MKQTALLLPIALLLTACATAPRPVQVLQVCPIPPALEPLPDGALEHDYIGTMQRFLQGKLPEQPNYKRP